MKERYLIDGSFLLEKPTGIQRMAYETLIALDKCVEKGKIAIIIPEGSIKKPKFDNIGIIEKGDGRSKRRWVYCIPLRYAHINKMRLINIAGCFPVSRNSIVMIADTRLREGIFRETLRWRVTSSIKQFFAVHTAKNIVTISEYIKSRIIRLYHVPPEKIKVVYCGWQHYERIIPDEKIFEKFHKIKKKEYYYTVGSIAPHKNYKWIIEAAKNNPKNIFVVSGAMRRDVWSDTGVNNVDNIIYTDYVTDEEMKALMMGAKAFLFPTLYEGFGIPPMEAISVGVDCIVSDIPVMHEIYGNSVHYINPYDSTVNIDSILRVPLEKEVKNEVLKRYSWEKAAMEWVDLLQ